MAWNELDNLSQISLTLSLLHTGYWSNPVYICNIRIINIINNKKINTMKATEKTTITVQATVNAPVEKVWDLWTDPRHIVQWNSASDDWHTTRAENDLREGGKFSARMEAKDGSMGFDFEGIYDEVKTHEKISYTMSDNRKVEIYFKSKGNNTVVTETFEAEDTNSAEVQQTGWQAIMNNFKQYVETVRDLERLHFNIKINAPVEKVYKTMLEAESYNQWTTEFASGSHYKGSWEKGSKILFLAPGENGEVGGMVSRIKENIPNKFVSIEHLGMVNGDKEITSGPEVEFFAGALENYSFKEDNGQTLLSIEMDSSKEYKPYFQETWPKALDKLKQMCEGY